MTDLTREDMELIEAAREAIRLNYDAVAYHHTVGAAVRCKNGNVYRGVNVYSMHGACAEQIAIGAAITAGEREFETIVAVRGEQGEEILPPCGNCRQILCDYMPECWVIVSADGMEDKILALYACGMSQRDIAEQIKELYGVEISPELVTKISEKIMPEVTAWQNRPLEPVYPFVFMDAIHYKVREDRRYVTKAAYVVLGVTMDGRKDILGVWIGEHENSKFWLNVLNDLKSRGVLDVYLFCTDGLCGMMQAIEAVFPKSRLQRCIVHQVRSSTRYVSYKDIKKVVADLKKIYGAVTLEEAEKNLQTFAETWRKQYPSCVKSWEENWPVLSTFFEYPVEIRKIIYTTNIIEGLNRQFRQITKNKPSFTNDDSLRRMLYLASQRIVKHWHARCQNWDLVLSQLEIMFADRAVG